MDEMEVWTADDGATAEITFVKWSSELPECSVVDKRWTDSTETLLQKIRRWLHLT